jgi:hypothetical protein
MKSQRGIVIFTVIVLLTAMVTSCRKKPLSWQTDLLVPLLHSRLGVDDIFTDSLLVENPDQSWKLVLDQEITGFDNSTLFEVHDTLSKDIFEIPIYFRVPPGQKVIEQESKYQMELGDVELNSAKANNAVLRFYVTNTVKEKLRIKYEVLSGTKDGKHFEVIDDVPAADANGSSHMTKTINLSDYDMDFTGPNHDRTNMVVSKTTVWLHPDGDTTWVTPSDSIVVTSVFEELDIEYAKGYFGQKSETVSDSSEISTFNNFKKGAFNINKATAEFRINNYIGADIGLKINEISSINTKTGKHISLADPVIGRNINVLRAKEAGAATDPVIPTKYVFPLKNSNIEALIENQPDMIGYSLDYHLNPLGNISGGKDFMYSGKTLEGIVHMEIPLNINMDSLVISEISQVNFDPEEKIKKGEVTIVAKNHFPYDVEIQFYMLDEKGNIVDSLLKDNIKSNHGIIDNNGFVKAATTDRLIIGLDEETLARLRKTKEILVWARINNNGKTTYQLYQNYNIDIKIIFDGSYEN